MFNALEKELQAQLEQLKAADVADLVLSPFVNPKLLLTICHEAGPTNWVVNRSDVYDETIEALLQHPDEVISRRAAEKIKIRKSTLTTLTPPLFEGDCENIPDHSVEDFLGHPLCPFEAILYFSTSSNDDHRASSCLSLTRRLLEHPPNWEINPHAKTEIARHFGRLLNGDPSPMVRGYAARIPILSSADITESTENETHIFVLGRVLQNPARSIANLEEVAADQIAKNDFVANVLALDAQLPMELRRKLRQKPSSHTNELIHSWHL
ncbi:hypothetical protein GW915_01730 [bacterium]|nr:hypothetical protein [bacterium]